MSSLTFSSRTFSGGRDACDQRAGNRAYSSQPKKGALAVAA
eukprot:CAMPEP_0115827806 /NCGR_PEP_ID=MMETSP0287-20121206/239_1 /TAXON_ID=412157 /ORGANISM="Chrysochromulina rotalis, Strain UIO044" /LENGTH=40 /DNA_ID= /DNA_START= /DNA_END= /DNA_ORIENTATION=